MPQNWPQKAPRTLAGSVHTDLAVLSAAVTTRSSETDDDGPKRTIKFLDSRPKLVGFLYRARGVEEDLHAAVGGDGDRGRADSARLRGPGGVTRDLEIPNLELVCAQISEKCK